MSLAASLIIFIHAMLSDAIPAVDKVKMCDDMLAESVMPHQVKILIGKARQLLVGGTNEPLLDLLMRMEDRQASTDIQRILEFADMTTVCFILRDQVRQHTEDFDGAYQEVLNAVANI